MTSATGTAEPQGQADRLQGVDILYAALFCLLWSGNFSSSKIALFDCPPLILLCARYLIAGVILFGVAAAVGSLRQLTLVMSSSSRRSASCSTPSISVLPCTD